MYIRIITRRTHVGKFDHLVADAHRLTLESGLLIGENVGIYDAELRGPSPTNRKAYKVRAVTGDDVTIARPVEGGEEVLTMKQDSVFAIGIVQGLVDLAPESDIVYSRITKNGRV